MTHLHTVNKPVLLDLCLRSIEDGDALLLIEDGVYAATQTFSELLRDDLRYFVLQNDMAARGLNSSLISLTPSRSVVVRLLEHNQPELETLDDVREEIRIELQFEKVSERAGELGRTITTSLQSGGNIDTILEAQDLTWNQLNELERNSQQLPPELVDNVFGMSEPAADTVNVEGFQLASGAYVVVELQRVNPGTLEDFEEAELASLTNFLEQQQADSELGAMIIGLQNRADITR